MTESKFKFPEIIKTPRLEMRLLTASPKNAHLVYQAVKDENPSDFYFNPIGGDHYIPHTVDEMMATMQRDDRWNRENGASYYIFYNGDLIGYRRIYFFTQTPRTLQSASVWFLRRAWGHGFSAESMAALENLAFNTWDAHRITRQCDQKNRLSANSIKRGGYHLDGVSRQMGIHHDGTIYDNMMWSKLKSEYVK